MGAPKPDTLGLTSPESINTVICFDISVASGAESRKGLWPGGSLPSTNSILCVNFEFGTPFFNSLVYTESLCRLTNPINAGWIGVASPTAASSSAAPTNNNAVISLLPFRTLCIVLAPTTVTYTAAGGSSSGLTSTTAGGVSVNCWNSDDVGTDPPDDVVVIAAPARVAGEVDAGSPNVVVVTALARVTGIVVASTFASMVASGERNVAD